MSLRLVICIQPMLCFHLRGLHHTAIGGEWVPLLYGVWQLRPGRTDFILGVAVVATCAANDKHPIIIHRQTLNGILRQLLLALKPEQKMLRLTTSMLICSDSSRVLSQRLAPTKKASKACFSRAWLGRAWLFHG